MPSKILDNLRRVKEKIRKASIDAGRSYDSVKLVAVSKFQPIEAIKELFDAGHKDFGENRVQELLQKYPRLENANWHLIGHLQTNKVNKLLRETRLTLIHSLDRKRLADKIENQARNLNLVVPCLIEVKIAPDATKHGILPDEVEEFIEYIMKNASHISLLGFMGMATFTDNKQIIARQFATLYNLREKFSAYTTEKHPLKELSMGMSNDYEIAIREGATLVRVGSAIFHGT